MKLIDLLVKELPNRGGWPQGALSVAQDNNGYCWGYKCDQLVLQRHGLWRSKSGFAICRGIVMIFQMASDWNSSFVTKSEYESALAASEGWIEWDGGECPVEGEVIVEVKFNGHSEPYKNSAASLDWHHVWTSSNIIAYRLHKPDINSRANDDRLEQDLKEIEVSGKYLDDVMNIPVRIDRLEQDLNECIGHGVDPAWHGEGLPPVGVECEYKFPYVNYRMDFSRGKVLAYGSKKVFMEHWSSKNEFIQSLDNIEFRPLRTEAEKAREETIMCMSHSLRANGSVTAEQLNRLYSDIASGVIPGIRLESK